MYEISGICVLCFNEFSQRNLEDILEITKEMLNILLIKTDPNESDRLVICRNCSDKVEALFRFKSACIYTDDFIAPFVDVDDEKEHRVEFKELFIKVKGHKEVADMLSDKDICRLCMEVVDVECLHLDTGDTDVLIVKNLIERCIPEVNVYGTKNGVVCYACVTLLRDYADFLDVCSGVANKIQLQCLKSGADGFLQTTPVAGKLNKLIDSQLNETITDKENDCRVNTEGTEVASSEMQIEEHQEGLSEVEQFQEGLNGDRSVANNAEYVSTADEPDLTPLDSNSCDRQEPSRVEQQEDDVGNPPEGEPNENQDTQQENDSPDQPFKCDLCKFRTKHKSCLKTHMMQHQDASEIKWFECGECSFKAKQKSSLTVHMSLHKDPSERKWFECDSCSYKSTQKSGLKKHVVKHKDASLKCGLCSFKTKYESCLKKHMITHKDDSEIKWFKCSMCDYKCKDKYSLIPHMVIHHKDPSKIEWLKCNECKYKSRTKNALHKHLKFVHKEWSEAKWFKCDLCNHKTKQKKCLQTHMLIHKDPAEIKWFECHLCSFKGKQKVHLTRHMLVHRDPSQSELFKCGVCDFTTSRKDSFKSHDKWAHKDPSEIEWIECDMCGYKAKWRSHLKGHMLAHHAASSEMEFFKCDLCDFMSTWKASLKTHKLVHADPSKRHVSIHLNPSKTKRVEEQSYRCNVCDYTSDCIKSFIGHMLVHKDPSEVEWFKCASCDFQSNRKHSLKRHIMSFHSRSSEVTKVLQK
ncbi:hypothetical protein NQ315_007403 [Exocentrus adspersus]|uniref:C2H2-type domain-containing protein n=1 Tax=Exocentrus adspersus TaxID=1586481 RepID=A0AAV8VIF4_9CUCU|nr:hypothetical protein NQ315_007403 [Exocentrus adspersus]